MDEPKIIQIDRDSTTSHEKMRTVQAALYDDGGVAWRGDARNTPEDWTEITTPHRKNGVRIIQVSISCALEHNNLHANMSLLYDDGVVMESWPYLGWPSPSWRQIAGEEVAMQRA